MGLRKWNHRGFPQTVDKERENAVAIFKCKMCGAELTLVPGSTVCTCEYCGTKQTVPSADNEKKLTLKRMLAKKAYYSKSMAMYQTKWQGNPALRKQFGLYYRFLGVFIENGKWKRLLRHPILATVMYLERIMVGFTYLLNR